MTAKDEPNIAHKGTDMQLAGGRRLPLAGGTDGYQQWRRRLPGAELCQVGQRTSECTRGEAFGLPERCSRYQVSPPLHF
jgi:hypothetical protein